MRYHDTDDLAEVNAEPWQEQLLKMNPSYCSWGPHEDYMCKEGTDWDSRQLIPTWKEFGPWNLDDLNECVNFYFEVTRESVECGACGGTGYHPDGLHIVNSFYAHMNPEGVSWNDKITEDEVQALVDAGRLTDWTRRGITPTAAEVNAAQHGRGLGHDAINRHVLIGARLKRLGIPETCPHCEGRGHQYTTPVAHVSLVLWLLHPRKGCSRGVEITRIEESELPDIFDYLRTAAERNAARFSKILTN